MSTWSLETVALEDETVSSSSDYHAICGEENGPCDSTTSESDDLFYWILDITPPEPTGVEVDEVFIGEDVPDQSHWVEANETNEHNDMDDDEPEASDEQMNVEEIFIFE